MIGRVAAARKLLTLVFYGLRDRQSTLTGRELETVRKRPHELRQTGGDQQHAPLLAGVKAKPLRGVLPPVLTPAALQRAARPSAPSPRHASHTTGMSMSGRWRDALEVSRQALKCSCPPLGVPSLCLVVGEAGMLDAHQGAVKVRSQRNDQRGSWPAQEHRSTCSAVLRGRRVEASGRRLKLAGARPSTAYKTTPE